MPGQNQIGDYKLIELAGEGSFGKVRRHCCLACLPCGCFQHLRCPALAVPHLPAASTAHSQVWKARRTGSLQTVAVKLITKHGKNEKDLRNLRQEIEILRKLQHPNIIAMLDAFETKHDFCVVTEFAQGGLLRARVGAGLQRQRGQRNWVLFLAARGMGSGCWRSGCCGSEATAAAAASTPTSPPAPPPRRAVPHPGGRPVPARGRGAQRGAPAGGRAALPAHQPHHPPRHEAAKHPDQVRRVGGRGQRVAAGCKGAHA